MKRIFLTTLLISSIGVLSFSKINSQNNRTRKIDYMKELDQETKEKIIELKERKLLIRKEMTKQTPDWNKVEKLNEELAVEKAKLETKMQKQRRENPDK